jgi:serine phosphatase RsbU (regulator of sigma subunit)
VRFVAAGEGVEVGGDFYELFQTGDHTAVALIGDVCGKGPDAAAVSALARHTLRAAAEFEHRPGEVLSLLHRVLREQNVGDRFCTVAYAQLTIAPDGLQMRLVRGGHPPPLVVHADGSVEAVGRTGTLVGSYFEPDLEETTVELGPGDACVLYTDGVTEVRRWRAEVFGHIELETLLSGCAGASPDEIAERVESAVMRASGGAPRDDIAILVIAPAGIPAMLSAAAGAAVTNTSLEEVDGPEA